MKKFTHQMTVDSVGEPTVVIATAFGRYIEFVPKYDARNVQWKSVKARRWRYLPTKKVRVTAKPGEPLGYLRTVCGCDVVTITLTDEGENG